MLDNEIQDIMSHYQTGEAYRGVTPVVSAVFDQFIKDVRQYPADVIHQAIEDARLDSPTVYFCPALVLDKIRTLMELRPDYNPNQQWALVEKYIIKHGEDNTLYKRKILFKNMITNLVIKNMGGQDFICQSANEKNDLDQQRRFIDEFRKMKLPCIQADRQDEHLCKKLLKYDPAHHTLIYVDSDNSYQITHEDADNAIYAALYYGNFTLAISPQQVKQLSYNDYKEQYRQQRLTQDPERKVNFDFIDSELEKLRNKL
ncbi:hypothetical protein [Succinimonas sp.]|uniref:hypothetical protein n=1 Tax=Succinimonas sp. TaxID=1936151 RepID=UPI0038639958